MPVPFSVKTLGRQDHLLRFLPGAGTQASQCQGINVHDCYFIFFIAGKINGHWAAD
jgi:hypothetical protein